MKKYSEFVKAASLFMDTNLIPDYVKQASYGIYREAPGIPTKVLQDSCKILENPIQKTACEMIAANRLHDSKLVVDYGENNDIAKHAGIANFLGSIKNKVIGTGINQSFNVAVGSAAPVADQFQKKDSFQQGSPENIDKANGVAQ